MPSFALAWLRGLLMTQFVGIHAVFDEAYGGLKNRESVPYGVGKYVQGQPHVSGMESSWSMLERVRGGVLHGMFPARLVRYEVEFEGRHNARCRDSVDWMAGMVRGVAGKRLRYRDLIGHRENSTAI